MEQQCLVSVKLFLIQFSMKTKTRTNNDIVQALHKKSHWRLGTFSAACSDIFLFSSVSCDGLFLLS